MTKPSMSEEPMNETIVPTALIPRTTSPVFESELQHAQVRLLIQLGAEHGELRLRLEVWNRSPSDTDVLEFTTALHAYLRVAALTDIRITGLAGCEFIDQSRQQEIEVEKEPTLVFRDGELDRIYRRQSQHGNVLNVERVNTQQGTIRIETSVEDFPELVIWNPGPQKSHELVDLGDHEWMSMVCVEPAVVTEPVRLHRDERWCGQVAFTYVAVSNTSPRARG
jgi:glucose-6-phosphate 1-epimerase